MIEFISNSVEQTEKFAENFGKQLKAGAIIAYIGGLGMGKTAFTHGLCRVLGIDDSEVSSPTFSLVNQYEGEEFSLFHFDMYRINGVEDLESTGFFDYMDMNGVMAIEWSENISWALPPATIYVDISSIQNMPDSRKIIIEGDLDFENFSD